MRYYFALIISILLSSFQAFAQTITVHHNNEYYIFANLNTYSNTLSGYIDLKYYNNSKDELEEIYFYLYPNEFKNKTTQLAKELFDNENTKLYFFNQEELGGYDELIFRKKEKELNWSYTNKDKTIVKLNLDDRLKPKESTTLRINYTLKLPKNITGLGYSKTQYSLINWYPKPLLYNENGWNNKITSTRSLMLSDYADYNVTIRVPDDFNVVSSGALSSKNDSIIIENSTIPTKANRPPHTFPIDKPININYIGENVKDFALIVSNQLNLERDSLKTIAKISKKIFLPKAFSLFKYRQPSNELFPLIAFNENDGFMAGLLLNSTGNKFRYKIAPLYGFRSKSIIGYFDLSTDLKPNKRFRKIVVGVNGRRFHRLRNTNKDFNLKYSRISLYATSYFNSNCNKSTGYFNYSFSLIKDENYTRQGTQSLFRYINSAEIVKIGGNIITPYEIKLGLEHQYYFNYLERHYLKVSSEVKASYMYKRNRSIHIRLYGATYLFNTNTYSTGNHYGTLSLIGHGLNDYSYDHFFISRSAQSGFYSNQLSMNTGGFKTAINSGYGIGQSNKFVASANIRFDLPMKIFIKPYFDIGIYGDLPTISDGYRNKVLYSSGFVFQIIKDKIEVYLPILNSKEIEDIYKENGSFFNRFSFLLDLKLPIKD